jgi:hypothetical protein
MGWAVLQVFYDPKRAPRLFDARRNFLDLVPPNWLKAKVSRNLVPIRAGEEPMRDEDNMVYQWALSGDWVAVRDYLGKRILSAEVRKKLLALPDVPPWHQDLPN